MNTATTALTALLLAAAASADTLTVGPSGSGADFDEIADAVAAAAPGDTVLVLPGEYTDTKELVIDKPLTLIGAGSAVTTYKTVPGFPLTAVLPLLVKDLGPGEEVRVAGLRLISQVSVVSGGATVAVLSDCEGPVSLVDVTAFGSPGDFGSSGAVLVQRCDQVLLDGCTIASGGGALSSTLVQPGLRIVDSTVHVNACAISGAAAPGSADLGVDGGPGILATDSLVRLSRSSVVGGKGSGDFFFFSATQATGGGPALAGSGVTYYVRGGGQNMLAGGNGGAASTVVPPVFGAGAPAIAIAADSLASTTPDAILLAGADGDGTTTAPAVDPTGTYAQQPQSLATLAHAPSIVFPGGSTTAALGGEPGSLWFPFFSLEQAPALAIPGVAGVVVLPLGGYASLPVISLDGSGAAAFGVAIPAVPALSGWSVLVQGLAAGPSGTLSISSPSLVAIAQ